MDNLIKNLYDRLYRKGIRTSRDELRSKILEINPNGILTDTEKNLVVDHFVNLAGDVSDKAALSAELVTELYPKSEGLTIREAKGLVFEQAENLNLSLSLEQIKMISEEIVNQKLNEAKAIEFIYNLIADFIKQDEANFNQKIENTHQQTISLVNDSYFRRSEKTHEIIEKVGREIVDANKLSKTILISLRELQASLLRLRSLSRNELITAFSIAGIILPVMNFIFTLTYHAARTPTGYSPTGNQIQVIRNWED